MLPFSANLIADLHQKISAAGCRGKTKLIAVDGRGGSGKSTLVQGLCRLDSSMKVVPVDFFPCRPEEHPFHELGTQSRVSLERIVTEVLRPLAEGRSAAFRRSCWWVSELNTPEEAMQVSPGGTVIIEGCYALHAELRAFYDFKVFVDCPPETATRRALARDGGEKDRVFWEQVYTPNESEYIRMQKPQLAANLVIDSSV